MYGRASRSLIGLVLVVASLYLPVSSARAQIDFGIIPSIVEIQVEPGDTGEQEISLTNYANTAVTLVASIESIPGLQEIYLATDWISVSTEEFDVEAGATVSVPFGFAVPSDAPSGGAYSRVVIRTLPGDQAGGVQVGGELVIAVLFEVDGNGNLERELMMEEFAPTLEPDGRIGFRALVANSGNIQNVPTGGMTFTSTDDDDLIAELSVATTRLLPSITAQMRSEGTLPLPVGSSWTVTGKLFPGDPEKIDDLEPVTVEQEVTIDPQLAATASVCENLDRGPTVTVEQSNPGSIGLVPTIAVSLTDASGALIATLVSDDDLVAWPGDTTESSIEGLPQLAGGDYLMTISATIVQGLDPVVTEVPFSIGGFGDNVAPLCGSEPESTPDE